MKTNGSNFIFKWLLCLLIGLSSVNIAWCSAATDYFRSVTTATFWDVPISWESSPTGANPWFVSTLVPTNASQGITIQNNSTVTLFPFLTYTATKLTIASGGTLYHTSTANLIFSAPASGNAFTISGTYVLNGTQCDLLTNSAKCQVNAGGLVRVDYNDAFFFTTSDDFARSNQVTFLTDAVFQWNIGSKFEANNNQVYFPKSTATSPIFRVTQNLTGANFVGTGTLEASKNVSFWGRFEVNSGFTVEFGGGGTKFFRDGIGGAGTIVHQQSVTFVHGPCGLFYITGTPINATVYGTVTINIEHTGNTIDLELSGTTTISGSPTLNIGTATVPDGYLVVSGTLTHNGTVPIKLTYGSLSISGTISNSSTGFFTENNTSSTYTNINITGSASDAGLVNFTNSPLDFKSITVNRSGGSFTLTDNATIESAASATTTLTAGALILNGKTFTMKGTLTGTSSGTFTGSFSSEIYVGGSGANGVFYFTLGAQLLNKLTLNRTIVALSTTQLKLGSSLTVNNLVLTNGILATGSLNNVGTNSGNLLTLTSPVGLTLPATYNASFIATCKSNGTGYNTSPTFTGGFGFRIQNVGASDVYFPVAQTYLAFASVAATPNRMMMNNSGSSDDFTVVVKKQLLPNTPNPSINRIWYVNEATPGGSKVTMKLFFMKRNGIYGTTQDEVETGFDWFKTDLVQENYINAYLNKAAGADEKDWSNAIWTDQEVYGLYTEGVSADYLSTTNGINNFTRFSVTNANTIILPVTITNLRASQKGNDIQIDWSAMNELNMDSYEIEHSQNGISFTTVTKIPAINNGASLHNYTGLDTKPIQGTNFYRIKAIDKNGAVSYTAIVSVNIVGGKATITVLPNPVQNRTMNVRFDNLDAGNYTMLLYNSVGQLVFNKKIVHGGGSAAQSYALPAGVRPGVYALIVLNDASKNEFRNTIVIAE